MSLTRGWAVQRRVIGALLMRDIQLRWGRRNLGFAWMFAEPLVFAFPVLALWSFMHAPYSHGLPFIAFMWSGYLPLLMFRHVTGQSLHVIRGGGALLYHRAVTPFDLFAARMSLEIMGNWGATALSFMIFYMMGFIQWPYNPSLFLLGVLYMTWWSISVALIIAPWSERSEIVHHIWPPISYIYLPVSGFFYLADWLPLAVRNVALTVLPSLHCYEMIRGGLFGQYIQVHYDLPYLSFVLAVLTLFGLWLIHNVRPYLRFD
jgi:capsular polysaccharide transport system permease protein